VLVTCDEPVIPLGGPGFPRSERAGYINAGVVAFPLSPSAVLLMFHPGVSPAGPPELDHAETAELNREIVAASARWSFERSSRKATLGFRVPPAPSPAFVHEGPLPQAKGAKGDLYRNYKPTRWFEPEAPPWPVLRWWADVTPEWRREAIDAWNHATMHLAAQFGDEPPSVQWDNRGRGRSGSPRRGRRGR
jgi:hypothetical protein